MQMNSALKANGLITPLTRLLDQMAAHGAVRFYAKRIAPNDNSKNQVYLGGGFGALNIIPHGPVEGDDSDRAGSVETGPKPWFVSSGSMLTARRPHPMRS
ncbi:hypothetical protein [Loktanella sp. M215]|uniref:hypothetical protein n=1 Tax=Loktanella sp. M215 TaxID=2675431 RepID=UPI001F48B033|nr:hypothetical protein [Loktanella sp. M215]